MYDPDTSKYFNSIDEQLEDTEDKPHCLILHQKISVVFSSTWNLQQNPEACPALSITRWSIGFSFSTSDCVDKILNVSQSFMLWRGRNCNAVKRSSLSGCSACLMRCSAQQIAFFFSSPVSSKASHLESKPSSPIEWFLLMCWPHTPCSTRTCFTALGYLVISFGFLIRWKVHWFWLSAEVDCKMIFVERRNPQA